MQGDKPPVTCRTRTSIRTISMAPRPELKVEDENGFIQLFRNLPVVPSDTIRIFDRGDWYSCHGDDALYVARTVRDSPHFDTQTNY
jgi:hypothetical protein